MEHIIFYLFILTLIQSGYDFLMWFVINKENPESNSAVYLRYIKLLLDFPVTIYITLHFGLFTSSILSPVSILILFYFLKWFHGCDTFYNIYSIIFGKKPCFWGYWRWWTPIGLIRCIFFGHCFIKGYSYLEYQFNAGVFGKFKIPMDLKNVKFSRGMVNVNEAHAETVLGMCIIILFLIFL